MKYFLFLAMLLVLNMNTDKKLFINEYLYSQYILIKECSTIGYFNQIISIDLLKKFQIVFKEFPFENIINNSDLLKIKNSYPDNEIIYYQKIKNKLYFLNNNNYSNKILNYNKNISVDKNEEDEILSFKNFNPNNKNSIFNNNDSVISFKNIDPIKTDNKGFKIDNYDSISTDVSEDEENILYNEKVIDINFDNYKYNENTKENSKNGFFSNIFRTNKLNNKKARIFKNNSLILNRRLESSEDNFNNEFGDKILKKFKYYRKNMYPIDDDENINYTFKNNKNYCKELNLNLLTHYFDNYLYFYNNKLKKLHLIIADKKFNIKKYKINPFNKDNLLGKKYEIFYTDYFLKDLMMLINDGQLYDLKKLKNLNLPPYFTLDLHWNMNYINHNKNILGIFESYYYEKIIETYKIMLKKKFRLKSNYINIYDFYIDMITYYKKINPFKKINFIKYKNNNDLIRIIFKSDYKVVYSNKLIENILNKDFIIKINFKYRKLNRKLKCLINDKLKRVYFDLDSYIFIKDVIKFIKPFKLKL